MSQKSHKELFSKNLISEEQFQYLEGIDTNKVVSVFYELRTLMYLGVLLLSAGLGILIYKYVGEVGHILSIILMVVVDVLCFWYVYSKKVEYSNEAIDPPTPYYDYVLLLGSLAGTGADNFR